MEAENQRRQHLSRIAKMLHDQNRGTLSWDEQQLMDVRPTDLPFIFITLDKIKNEVNSLQNLYSESN